MGSSLRRIARHHGGSVRTDPATAGSAWSTAASAALSAPGDLTIAAHVYRLPHPAGFGLIFGLCKAVYNDGLLLFSNSGNLEVACAGGAFIWYAPVSALALLDPAAGWHRVVVAAHISTGVLDLYVDNALIGSSPPGIWTGCVGTPKAFVGDALSIGFGAGYACDFAVDIGHAWTAADVLADYVTGEPPATYTHRWPFDDGAGTTARATRGGLAMTLAAGAGFSLDSPDKGRGAVQNIVPYGSDLTNPAWTMSNAVPGAYGGVLPAGYTHATTLTDAGAGSVTHFAYMVPILLAALFGRKVILRATMQLLVGFPQIAFYSNGGGTFTIFDLSTGTVGATAGGAMDPGIRPLGGGWYDCWYTITATSYIAYLILNAANPYVANGTSIAVAALDIEIPVDGQTTPNKHIEVGSAPLAVYGLRDERQNLLPYSDDLTHWPVQSGAPTVTPGTITSATANTLIRQMAPQGVGNTAGVKFAYQIELKANAPCTCPITLADATDGTPTATSNCPLTTAWQQFMITITTTTPGVGLIGCYIGDGINFPTGVTVYARHAQLSQCPDASEFIATAGAIENPSGAPRSVA